jgi:hypothetical protein
MAARESCASWLLIGAALVGDRPAPADREHANVIELRLISNRSHELRAQLVQRTA